MYDEINAALQDVADSIDEGQPLTTASINVVKNHIDEIKGLIYFFDCDTNDDIDMNDEFSMMVANHFKRIEKMYVEVLNNVEKMEVEK